jgi:hypothetical protein
MSDYKQHQFGLFGFQRPIGKVPISAERIREAKEAVIRGDSKTAIQILRELNEGLENFERRITHK